jgi:hypothetical protein
MKLPLTARFVDRDSGEPVPGLIRSTTERDLLLWTGWRYGPSEEDRSWDWWSIYQECRTSRERYECYAALAQDDLQGLAVLDLKTRKTGVDKTIIVDYLSTNPANRNALHGLKYVGMALMAAAIVRSLECGAKGRIWLESLSGATGFYENLGMVRQPLRSAEGNLIFTLEPETAEELLEEIKKQGIIKV